MQKHTFLSCIWDRRCFYSEYKSVQSLQSLAQVRLSYDNNTQDNTPLGEFPRRFSPVPGGLAGGPRAYQDQFLRGFESHRVHTRKNKGFFLG